MATYKAFRCDSCGVVIEGSQRTRRVTKIEGPPRSLSGEYVEDLCPECVAVPEDVVLKPLRRRTPKAS